VMKSELSEFYNVNVGDLSASLATYYYIYAPLQLFVGVLFDRYGGKRLLVPATLIVALGCILPAYMGNHIAVLTLARFFMGLGSAFAFVGVMYLVTVWHPSRHVAFFSGLTTTLGMLGAIMGGAVLAPFVDSLGWQDAFFWSGIIGLGVALLLLMTIPKTPYWEEERREYNVEHKFFHSLKVVLKNRQTWYIGIVGSCLYLSLSVFGDLWGVQYIMHVSDVPKSVAANAVALLYWGWMIGAPFAGWFSDKVGKRKMPMFWGSVISAILFWGLILFPSLPIGVLKVLLFCAGLVASTQVACFVANIEANPDYAKGTAIGVTNMIVMLLGGVFQPVVGYILQTKSRMDLSLGPINCFYNTATDFRSALIVIPVMLAIAAVVCLFIKEPKHPKDPVELKEIE